MEFGNTSGIKSPFSPRVRQSITGRKLISLSSAKKNQGKYLQSAESQSGDVIYKTPLCTVETFGMPLPVMVTETLTFASGDVSVRMSPCGWCWLVAGRRVLAWPREPLQPTGGASPAPAAPSAARELTLPQTDLAHKADLVVLFYDDGAQMPSCIGVSPEGIVRYWPSVGQEGVYADVSAELAGQECDQLATQHATRALVLATTTCTAVLLTPAVVDGRATVTCRTLRPPSGWLGGIGRKVSLLFFGSMPAHADTKLVGVVVLGEEIQENEESQEKQVSVALVAGGSGGPLLQLWQGAGLHGHSLRRPLADRQGDLNSLEVLALDVRASGPRGLLLLVAAAHVARSPDTRYGIAHVSVEDPANPRVTSLVPLRGGGPAVGGVGVGGEQEPTPRFLPLGNKALLYTHNYIALVSSTISNDKVEYIDVSMEGDRILGAELCDGVPLLFSKKHGVLVLSAVDCLPRAQSVCDSPMGSPCPSDMYDGNLSLYEIDPHEVSAVTTDACGQLKTAFLFHVRRELAASRALLDRLFPAPPPASPSSSSSTPEERDVDAVLDRTVLRIATEILDDIPAGDPRWKQRVTGQAASIALGSSAALQLAAQLRDKQRAFSLFVDFLRASGLYNRLGQVTDECEGGVVSSPWALCRLAEQLAAAVALRRLQRGDDAQIIDAAIYQVVCGSEASDGAEEPEVEAALSSGALSPADACYRRVSRVARVLRALAAAPAAPAAPGDASAAAAGAAATINIVTAVLSSMHKVRAQWSGAPLGPRPQHGPRALLPALVHLHKKAVSEYGHNCPDPTVRAQVNEAAAALADLLLADGALLPPAQYERMRRDLIQPHVAEGQLERAAVLAEKFKDFELLIEMCVQAGDLDRLYTYIDKYIDEGMCETTFAWLCSGDGRRWSLLVRALGGRLPARLAAWLRAAPAPPRPALLALHQLQQRRHRAAAAALQALAAQETLSQRRMCTMASLAKLCLVASEEEAQSPELWSSVESCLALGELLAALPRDLRVRHGLDAQDTRVVPPEDLVQMYIESDSKSLTEYDYKKALDLTDYIQDMEMRDELRLRVWCAAVLRDDWSSCRVDAPADELHDKVFFRLIDLVHVMGGDLELLLPPLEDIVTARELAELVSDPRVHFIIKYGYECLQDGRLKDQQDDDQ